MMFFIAANSYMRRNLFCLCNYFEGMIPYYFPDEFRGHFRRTRQTCKLFTRTVMPTGRIPLGNQSGRAAISPSKQVFVFVWSMANQEPARAVVDRFNITLSSMAQVLKRVSQAAIDPSEQFIRWPNGEFLESFTKQNKLKINLPTSYFNNHFTANEKIATRTSFEDEGRFPVVIDGTHIRIQAPEDDPQDDPDAYINRKTFFSLNVQVTEKELFINITELESEE